MEPILSFCLLLRSSLFYLKNRFQGKREREGAKDAHCIRIPCFFPSSNSPRISLVLSNKSVCILELFYCRIQCCYSAFTKKNNFSSLLKIPAFQKLQHVIIVVNQYLSWLRCYNNCIAKSWIFRILCCWSQLTYW